MHPFPSWSESGYHVQCQLSDHQVKASGVDTKPIEPIDSLTLFAGWVG